MSPPVSLRPTRGRALDAPEQGFLPAATLGCGTGPGSDPRMARADMVSTDAGSHGPGDCPQFRNLRLWGQSPGRGSRRRGALEQLEGGAAAALLLEEAEEDI